MSKRQSAGGNTLFNYFTKISNGTNDTKSETDNTNPKTSTENKTKDKRPLNSSDDEDEVQPIKRRKRIIQESDVSEDESGTSVAEIKSKFSTKKGKKSSTQLSAVNTKEEVCSPKAKKSSTLFTLVNVKEEGGSSKIETESEAAEEDTWLHYRLDFLKPKFIRDKNGKRPTDPHYDPRTLNVPNDFLTKQTPAMRQWWMMKKEHFDCVLFFKVGKFYELYHMDAVIGVNELGFSYMKGEFAHSGFPESAYGRMLNSLVELGYKVARVEQTETPEAMAERNRGTPKGGKQSKVVKREICQITNRGTRVNGLQDVEFKQPLSSYLLAIIENQSGNNMEFGVCFVDTTIGTFYLGQFADDLRYSRILTMVAQHPPVIVLEERKQLSNQTKIMLKNSTGGATIETLDPESQFYSSTKTLKLLLENKYFTDRDSGATELPPVLKKMISEDDSLNSTCKSEYDLAVRCLGACMWYLKDCLLDIQLLSMKKFEYFIPSDTNNKNAVFAKYMVLDSCILSGLNILGPKDTLESTLDYCCTPFGKRLLRQWICRPMCDVDEIKRRQDAISELLNRPDLMQQTREIMAGLPDLERLISKIHWMGNAQRAKNHPDSRAIFYEEKTYSKRKIQDFVTALNGFDKAASLSEIFSDVSSEMLKKHICVDSQSLYPDLRETIMFFKNSFDAEEAEREGRIIPQYAIDNDYDKTVDEINSIRKKLDQYLESQEKFFGCKISYCGTDKKRFQLDVPLDATHKITKDYFLEGAKKGSKPSKRYTTSETRNLLAQMLAAEARNAEVLHDLNRRIFEKFSAKYEKWSQACYCLAVIDVLLSLTEYTRSQSVNMCVPQVLPYSDSPRLCVKDGVHPYIPNIESFVPNDTELGIKNHSCVLILTGPNMGGKSTLMRQVALLTIMAQLGCHVPASEMTLTLVDRIFTRLGAHDDIMSGQSTFLVELSEASVILQHATTNSLVLLDELGRGTSTYDGTAIAIAYVDRLLKVHCRAMFSTHYYTLLDYFRNNSAIQLGHMACKVETEEDNATQETVIFMYKMISGPCPKSYGFNAARLAGISNVITRRAMDISRKMENDTRAIKVFRNIICNSRNVRDFLNKVLI